MLSRILISLAALLVAASTCYAQQLPCNKSSSTIIERLYFDVYGLGEQNRLTPGTGNDTTLLARVPRPQSNNAPAGQGQVAPIPTERVSNLNRWMLDLTVGGTIFPDPLPFTTVSRAEPKHERWIFAASADRSVVVNRERDGRCSAYLPFDAKLARRVTITPDPRDKKIAVTCPRAICGERNCQLSDLPVPPVQFDTCIGLTTASLPPAARMTLHFGQACDYPLELSEDKISGAPITAAQLIQHCSDPVFNVLSLRSGLRLAVPQSISVTPVKVAQ